MVKVKKFLRLIPTFVEVTRGKLVRGWGFLSSPIVKRVTLSYQTKVSIAIDNTNFMKHWKANELKFFDETFDTLNEKLKEIGKC